MAAVLAVSRQHVHDFAHSAVASAESRNNLANCPNRTPRIGRTGAKTNDCKHGQIVDVVANEADFLKAQTVAFCKGAECAGLVFAVLVYVFDPELRRQAVDQRAVFSRYQGDGQARFSRD